MESAEARDARIRASRALLTKSSAVPTFLFGEVSHSGLGLDSPYHVERFEQSPVSSETGGQKNLRREETRLTHASFVL